MSDTIKPAKLAPNILNSCYLARALKCLKVISVLFLKVKKNNATGSLGEISTQVQHYSTCMLNEYLH